MKLVSIGIENCKSYQDQQILNFDRPATIVVGPNGGGKSNTLDIVGILLRKYFRGAYTINRGDDAGTPWKDMAKPALFNPVHTYLERNLQRTEHKSVIRLTVEVGQSDVENVRVIQEHFRTFLEVFNSFRNKPGTLESPEVKGVLDIRAGEQFEYIFEDGEPQNQGETRAQKFRLFMESLGLYELLSTEMDNVVIKPSFVFYPPYRSAGPGDTRVTLSSESFQQLLYQFNSTTSKSQSGAIKMATAYFAEKRRRLESTGADLSTEWEKDPDVSLVEQFLEPIGYGWDLTLIDPNRNTYQVSLSSDEHTVDLSKASSGEKEVINFLLGIAALKTSGGVILIDEPELHLHPRWQGVVRDLLVSLAEETQNQIVLTTHSPVFITPQTLSSVMRISKRVDSGTTVKTVSKQHGKDLAALVRMINSLNNERLFFCDDVVLVEGVKDRIAMESLINRLPNPSNSQQITEVVDVGGKTHFDDYVTLLDDLEVPYKIVADLDYGVDLEKVSFTPLLEDRLASVAKDVLKNKKSKDRLNLAEKLEIAFETEDLSEAKEVWEYIKRRYRGLRGNLTGGEQQSLSKLKSDLQERQVFILSREIEHSLPPEAGSLSALLQLTQEDSLDKWIQDMRDGKVNSELLDAVAFVHECSREQLFN